MRLGTNRRGERSVSHSSTPRGARASAARRRAAGRAAAPWRAPTRSPSEVGDAQARARARIRRLRSPEVGDDGGVSGGLVWFDLGEESLQLLLLLLRREENRGSGEASDRGSWWYFCSEAPQVLTRLQPSPPAAEAGSSRPSDLRSQDDRYAQARQR